MNRLFALFFFAVVALASLAEAGRFRRGRGCSGSARYRVTFTNYLARTSPCRPFRTSCRTHGGRSFCKRKFLARKSACFRTIVPESGLVFSPISAVTHSPRVSLFRVGGKASAAVEKVCELGTNDDFLSIARASGKTSSVVGAPGPVMAGKAGSVEVTATCAYPYLTVLSMIAPSPDWIVQLNNIPLLNRRGSFVRRRSGNLIAYDCGTDDGDQFTPPVDTSLDIPTEPQGRIIPLFQDSTDPFGKRSVGLYKVERID